jgi:glutamate synthase domain-containing protein 2
VALGARDKEPARNLVLEVPAVREASRLVSKVAAVDAVQLNVGTDTTADALRDLVSSIRRSTGKKIPVLVGLGASRIAEEVRAVVKSRADGIVLDGQTTAVADTPDELFRFCRVPTIAAIPMARDALLENKALGAIELVAATGIRNGADAAKALALGADAVRIDEAALVALGYEPTSNAEHRGVYLSSQAVAGSGIKVAKFINSMTMEIALLARSLGKGDVHSLEFEDLSALTVEASMMAGVRLAGE